MADAPISIYAYFNADGGLIRSEDFHSEILDLKVLAAAVYKFADRIEMLGFQLLVDSDNFTLNILCDNPREYFSSAVENLITAEILNNFPRLEDLISSEKITFKTSFVQSPTTSNE